ncbi:arylsulfatase [Bauldia litoralis]|uniref:Arylsulfatase n=1 Tax=Bauldia litoralis TaxID=665467 RepID=A0A1G6EPY0_9HYPH|nr:arylsulfatase [Bauldia litoralis]SDB59396.1 arylsulfatase [Bauldia litoralis]
MRRNAALHALGGALVGAAMVAAAPAQAQEQKPNVGYILVDNVGWGNFGVYGGTIPTPRIDELASEGIRFTNYNVEAQCTPSRSAIMTGRHPVRSGTSSVPFPGTGLSGMVPWEYTAAELFSDAGYATALFGKWHLGDTQGRLPNNQGFDEWWGIMNSWDEAGYTAWPLYKESGLPVPMIWEGKKGEDSKPIMPLDLEVRPIVDEKYIIPKTVDYIKRNAAEKKPFFVYVGYSEAHPPIIGNPNFAGKSTKRGGLWADVIGEMDYRVGQIKDAVKEAGIEDNTIFIFSSDNADGGFIPQVGPGSNGPWRGNFPNTPFEGSMRVPAIVSWPGKVPAGVVTNEMFAAVDWLPTLAGMVGESKRVPTDRPIDGVDASALMLGKSETTGRDSYMFFGTDGELMSIKWKLYKTIFRYTEEPFAAEKPIIKPQFPMVYDLSSDPHEDNNLFYSDLTIDWVLAPNFKIIGEYESSVKEYPNIKVGEDFKGYKQ